MPLLNGNRSDAAPVAPDRKARRILPLIALTALCAENRTANAIYARVPMGHTAKTDHERRDISVLRG